MKSPLISLFTALVVSVVLLAGCVAPPAAQPAQAPAPAVQPAEAPAAKPAPAGINIVHYYSGDLGLKAMTKFFEEFGAATPECKVTDNTTGHEDFKTQILVMLAGDNPPDVFSYWEGARTQFVVDSNRLLALDDFWAKNNLDSTIPAGVKAVGMHNGKVYAVPQGVHAVGFFYNKHVMDKAGITAMPKTWDEFLAALDKIKAAGVAPIALGSKNRWPAQYWFDYLLARTAGPEFRTDLMAGKAPYTDPKVAAALDLWKGLIDKGYFFKDANAYDWNEAADQVAKGEAAMTLMGTWITGYWDGNGLKAGEDYDVFTFPIIDAKIADVAVGTIDGWDIPAGTKNADCAQKLILWMLKPDNQAAWAKGQGCLAAVNNVPADTYTSVQKKVVDYLAVAPLLSGYDLATTPPMAEGGLNMFAQMMNDPSKSAEYLAQVEAVAVDVFKK